MRALILVAAAVSLSGCGTFGGLTAVDSPAPATRYVIDDRAVRYGFLSLDTLASLADAAMDARMLTPGSAKARAIADALEKAKYWMNAASSAQKAGSVGTYNEAFDEATKALALVKQALGKSASITPSDYVRVSNIVDVDVIVSRLKAV